MSFLRNIIGRRNDAGGDESLIQSQGSEPVEVGISDIRVCINCVCNRLQSSFNSCFVRRL